MRYTVNISSVAEAEADEAFLQIAQIVSREFAQQWYSGLLDAIASLDRMPKRCTLAREDEQFSQDIRQLLYGKGRSAYRILFTVIESSGEVRILHVRHAARPNLDGENH